MRNYFLFISIFFIHLIPINLESYIKASDMPKVENVIDPISGSFVYGSYDFSIKSKEPIQMKRFYASTGDNLQYEGGWHFVPETKMFTTIKDEYQIDKNIAKNKT